MERIAEVNRRLALTDPLTGLPNRRHLDRYLDRVLARGVLAASHQTGSRLRPFSLALFDVDDFKRFNDRYGYPEGDRVLAAVATVFSRASANVSTHQSRRFLSRPESGRRPRGRSDSMPGSPFAARLGGDEFVVIFADMTASRVRAVADRIARAVARHPLLSPHGVTVSFGLAVLCRWQDALAAADRDLHRRRAAVRSRRTGAFGTFGRESSACAGFPALRGAPTPRRAPSDLRHERSPSDPHRTR